MSGFVQAAERGEAFRRRLRDRAQFYGYLLLVLGETPQIFDSLSVIGINGPDGNPLGWPVVEAGHVGYYHMIALWGGWGMLLSLQPTDERNIRITAYIISFLVSGLMVLFTPNFFLYWAQKEYFIAMCFGLCPIFLFVYLSVLATLIWRHAPPRVLHHELWRGVRLIIVIFGGAIFVSTVYACYETPAVWQHPRTAGNMAFTAWCFLSAIVVNAEFRAKIMNFCGSQRGTDGTEHHAAATIAGLLNGKSAMATISMAQQGFRALPFDKMLENDLCASGAKDSSSADPTLATAARSSADEPRSAAELAACTIPAKLGEVDAFVSHSWADSGPEKFKVLKQWAVEFHKEHGRWPNLWLDKACIDQNNIDGALACLSVFLSGCKTLLVIPGKTYPTRLWCMMELFTFLHIGGKRDNIHVVTIAEGATEEERRQSKADIMQGLTKMDARKAQCYKKTDLHKILAIVESSFGTCKQFNHLVRQVIMARRISMVRASIQTALQRVSTRITGRSSVAAADTELAELAAEVKDGDAEDYLKA